jgi:chorismate mutase
MAFQFESEVQGEVLEEVRAELEQAKISDDYLQSQEIVDLIMAVQKVQMDIHSLQAE